MASPDDLPELVLGQGIFENSFTCASAHLRCRRPWDFWARRIPWQSDELGLGAEASFLLLKAPNDGMQAPPDPRELEIRDIYLNGRRFE